MPPWCKNPNPLNAFLPLPVTNVPALLNKAAKDLSYSAAYLSNKFHTEAGVSFNNYLQNYRIENAKHLINTTNMLISEIASAVGYMDGKYFANVFKRITGMMPSYYKKPL